MTTRSSHTAARLIGVGALAALIGFPSEAADAPAQPKRERTACQRLTGDARQNCLSEASTRFAASRPSAAGEDPASLLRNATRRCEALPEPDQRHCMERMGGMGTTSGSVAGGGILRELIIREPAEAAAPAETK